MHAILLLAFFLTVWTTLAIRTVRKSRWNGVPLDREHALRALALRNARTTAQPQRTQS